MSSTEIAELCEILPPEKREEVADFARFLIFKQQDEAWEAIVSSPTENQKLEAFLNQSASEADEPLDLESL